MAWKYFTDDTPWHGKPYRTLPRHHQSTGPLACFHFSWLLNSFPPFIKIVKQKFTKKKRYLIDNILVAHLSDALCNSYVNIIKFWPCSNFLVPPPLTLNQQQLHLLRAPCCTYEDNYEFRPRGEIKLEEIYCEKKSASFCQQSILCGKPCVHCFFSISNDTLRCWWTCSCQ